jgi:hypothetical protein
LESGSAMTLRSMLDGKVKVGKQLSERIVGETQTSRGATRPGDLDLFREWSFQDHGRRRVLGVEMMSQAFGRGRHPEIVQVTSSRLIGEADVTTRS